MRSRQEGPFSRARPDFVLLLSLVVMGAVLLAGRAPVHATALDVTGTLVPQSDGGIGIDDGHSVYGAIGAIDLSPFVGMSVDLLGTIDDQTLFFSQLTLGTITVQDQMGVGVITTSGTIVQAGDEYQSTIEGITFTLEGSSELPSFVGDTVQFQGQLFATSIFVTSLGP